MNRNLKEKIEIRNKLKNYTRPGEIKAIGILLDRVDGVEYEKSYDEAIKELRETRNKFRTLAEDPNTDSYRRFLYDEHRKNLDFRIDELNISNGKPIETSQGPRILSYEKKGIMGALYRLKRFLGRNVIGLISIFGSLLGGVLMIWNFFLKGAAKSAMETVKTVGQAIISAIPATAQTLLSAGIELSNKLLWLSQNIVALFFVGVAFTVSMSRAYSLRKSKSREAPTILLVWGSIFTIGLFYLHKK